MPNGMANMQCWICHEDMPRILRCTGISTIGQQVLRLCHEYHDTGTQYRLDCLYAKGDWLSKQTGDIEYLCQNVRHGLTYSWQSGSFCWHIIEVLAHRRSASQRVRNLRHGSGILDSNSLFHCRGFPGLWLKIIQNWDLQSCPEWASWICMKPTFTSCESFWMLSFQPRHASRATNKPPMRMYLQYVVHFVYYRLLHCHHCFLRLWISGPSAHKINQDNFTFRCRRLIPLHAC